MKRLLLVDDEINVLHALRRVLNHGFAGKGIIVETFDDPEAALLRAGEVDFDVVVSDFRMPTMNGVAFLRCFKGIQPEATRLILSAATDFDALVIAINEIGIFRYLPKPWVNDDLIATVEAAGRDHQRQMEERVLLDNAKRQLEGSSNEELERLRLEAEEPGITHVNWGADGSVILDNQNP